jgi:hypothetical protein
MELGVCLFQKETCLEQVYNNLRSSLEFIVRRVIFGWVEERIEYTLGQSRLALTQQRLFTVILKQHKLI